MSRSAEKTRPIPANFDPFSRKKPVKWWAEVVLLKKQMVLSFLAGAVLPVVLAAVFQQRPPVRDVESDALTATEQSAAVDAGTVVTLQNLAGNLQQMSLEDYLTGVVLAEMPADFEEEALKAQAVVARTYTRRRMDSPKHGEAALCMDSGCCQGYLSAAEYLGKGGTQASIDKVRRAVTATDGHVLVYDGALIDATYFSCSGGRTEDAAAVWGQDVPYLQAVESPGEEAAPRFSDQAEFSAAELAALLGLQNDGDPADWFGAVTYTGGGGVDTILIRGQEFTGTALRKALGLRSTAFTVSVRGTTVTFTTRGFGHRVGMSQYGAQAMAQAGSGYEEILAHYYTGAELAQ